MPGSCENIHSDSCFAYLSLPWLRTQTWDNSWRTKRSKRRKLFTHLPFLLLPRNVVLPKMLSCCLLGAQGRRDQAVQLLPVPRLNQPLIEFVFYHSLELFPLIPETRHSSREMWKNHIHSQYYTPTTFSLSKQASRCIRKSQAWFLNLAETTRKGFY